MSTAGLNVFDATVQQSNEWLKEIAEEMHADDRQEAYLALRGTLHALRDHLVVDESAHLAAQLPMLVRGLYFEGWDPSRVPVRERKREDFLRQVGTVFERARPVNDPERAARAVFRTQSAHVSGGEIQQVRNALPQDVQQLFA